MVTAGKPPGRRGVRVDLSHEAVPNRIRAAVFWRLYERAEIRMIHRHLPRDLDVIELGASIGVTGAHILSRLALDRRLVAVEANPHLLEPLRRALKDQRVKVVNAALDYGATGKTVPFHVHASHLRSRLEAIPGTEAVTVPRITLGQLLKDEGIGDYALVADVEGAEAGLIMEDAAALKRCRVLIMELHGTAAHGKTVGRDALAARLRSLGFGQLGNARNTLAMARLE